MQFWKMHGIGNDFIVIDAIKYPIDDPAALARRLCSRHFSIGADGLILMEASRIADAKMRIINSDGSEPEMCGNGVRCAAKFLYDSGRCPRESMEIETLAGVMRIALELRDGCSVGASVNMGAPDFDPASIPVNADSNRIQVELDGRSVDFFCVSMGNPHAVTFDLYPEQDEDFRRLGRIMENHPIFPRRANIEFCRANPNGSISVKVWERGAGATMACGTGSCAVLAAAATLDISGRTAEIHLPGGTLKDRWLEDGSILMYGPAKTAFMGEIEV